jgi:hypothetical protein
MTDATTVKAGKTYKPKPPAGLARATVVSLWVYAALCIPSAIAQVWDSLALSKVDPATPMALGDATPGLDTLSELIVGLAQVLEFLALVVVGFIVLKWFYRVNLNAKVLKPSKQVSPAWSVGWFFVPFASLVMPFRGLREAWQISTDPERPNAVGVPPLLRWWWGAWLIANIAGNLSFRLASSIKTAGGQLASDVTGVIATALNLVSAVLLIRIVRELTERQVGALSRATFD